MILASCPLVLMQDCTDAKSRCMLMHITKELLLKL